MNLRDHQLAWLDDYVDASVTHFIVEPSGPEWPLDGIERLIEWRDARTNK
jgi:hypothetical protein